MKHINANWLFKLIIIIMPLTGICQKSPSFMDYISFYQKFLSESRGTDCIMYPSCSNYGMKAFNTYNPVKAFCVTSDRLLRCGHDAEMYNEIEINGNYRLLDTIPQDLHEPNQINQNETSQIFDTVSQHIMNYVKFLIINNEYDLALSEIYKSLYYKNCSVELYRDYIICLKAQKKYNKILYDYNTFFPDSIKNNGYIQYELGNVFIGVESYAKADSLFQIASQLQDSFLSDKSYIMSGYCKSRMKNFNGAIVCYSKIKSGSVFFNYANNNIEINNQLMEYKPKNPQIAGFLGIFPGLGYLYAGYTRTAISALWFNTIMAYATYTSFKTGNYGLGVLTGIFSISFYTGNIYGGIKSTRRYNSTEYESLYNQIKLVN